MLETIPQLKNKIARFVSGIVVVVICISAWSIYAQYKVAISFAERQAEDYARALAEHSESAFSDADRIMRDTVHDLKIEGGVERMDRRALFGLLQREAEGAPQVGTIFVTDKAGNMLANSSTFPQPPINVSDRDYFRHYQTTLGADLTVSDTVMSRLVARWRFNLLRPLSGANGDFNGVIAVAFEADYFNRFMNPTSLGERGKVLLVRNDGSPLVYEPYETNAYKADFRATALFSKMLPAAPSGTYQDNLGANDSQTRIISFQRLKNFPIVAVVTLHKGDILKPWGWKALFQSLVTIGLCIVIVVLTRIMFRHLDSLQSTRTVVTELEADLQHLQKVEALGQLAGGIAHDFNNLLTPILVYSEMIRRGLPEKHQQLRRVDEIITAAHQAKALNQKLMSFGRKQALRMEVLDLNEVIASCRDLMRSKVADRIKIDVELAPGDALVQADRNQLEQVFLTLAANAQDAIEAAGSIEINTSHILLDDEDVKLHPGMAPGSYMLVKFKDNGCGMDVGTLHRIYEPFFTTKTSGRSKGLGLATVYGIIKQQGGHIETRSQVGTGTSFLIYLPTVAGARAKVAAEPAAAAGSPGDTASATILLVEDNAMVREMAFDLLESEGFEVLVADSAARALEIEQTYTGTIDLLLTDVVMPEMDGVELYKKLQFRRPAMPVLYISGYTSDADIKNGKPGETVNFMKKPFTVELFIEKVRQVIGSH